jgi:hypothetical protein
MAMVVLVRCNDQSYCVAKESCLDTLAKAGEITAYLNEGKWIDVSLEAKRKARSGNILTTKRAMPAANV